MKKRILSMILCLCMLIGIAPIASATESGEVARVTFDGSSADYATIDAAWAAALEYETTATDKATITLLSDCTAAATLTNDKDYLVLNTGTYTLTAPSNTTGILNNGGSLEIIGVGKVTGTTKDAYNKATVRIDGGSVTVNGPTVANENGTGFGKVAVDCNENGSFHLIKGTVKSEGQVVFSVNGSVYLYSGTIESTAQYVFANYSGKVYLCYSEDPVVMINNSNPGIFERLANVVLDSSAASMNIKYGNDITGATVTSLENQTSINNTVNAAHYMEIQTVAAVPKAASVTIGSTTTEYETIDAAWAAALEYETTATDKATITLLSDCTAAATLTNDKDYLVLNTNGKTLTGKQYSCGIENNGGTLDIIGDGTVRGNTASHYGKGTIIINGGTVTVNGPTISNYANGYWGDGEVSVLCAGGAFVLKTGHIVSGGEYGLYLKGTSSAYLYSGKIESRGGRIVAMGDNTPLWICHSEKPLVFISKNPVSNSSCTYAFESAFTYKETVKLDSSAASMNIKYGEDITGANVTSLENQTSINDTVNAAYYIEIQTVQSTPALLDLTGAIVIGDPDEDGYVSVTYTGTENVTLAVTCNGEPVSLTDSKYQLPNFGTYELSVTASADGYNAKNSTKEIAWVESYTITAEIFRGNGSVSGGGTYPKNTVITLTATPDEGWTFRYWLQNGQIASKLPEMSVTVTNDATYEVWFVQMQDVILTTVTAQTFEYNGEPKEFVVSGTPNEGYTVQYYVNGSWTTSAPSAVGTYNVKITREEDTTYNSFERTIEGGLVIKEATPVVTMPSARSLVYDGTAQELITAGASEHGYWTYSLDGVTFSSDIPTGIEAGGYTVTCKFSSYASYADIPNVACNVTIAQREVGLDWSELTAAELVYSGTAKTLTATATGLVDGDNCIVTVELLGDNINFGTFSYRATVLSNANYKLPADVNSPEYTITPKTLTITADSHEVYVGSRQPELTCTVDGLVDGDAFETLPSCTTDANMYRAGTYDIIPSGADAGNNYSITYVNGTLTVKNYPYIPQPTYDVEIADDIAGGEVSASRKTASSGTTVTLTVEADKGYTLETLTVTNKRGDEIALTNKGDGEYTFRMPASDVTVEATFMEDNTMLNYFVDVPADAYYYDAVLWAVENEITKGADAVHFSPDMTCTRAQAVTFLWRAAGCPEAESTTMPFEDVAAGSYYYDAVLWAVENGITKGTSDTTFSPDADCTRAQIVTFLWRAQNSPAADAVNPFTDVAADDYYVDAVLWAVKEEVTNGTSATTFSSDADCTRAQIVTFLYRALADQ